VPVVAHHWIADRTLARHKSGQGSQQTCWLQIPLNIPRGPLIISIETKGRNLIEANKAVFNQKKKPILERINPQVRFIK